jgi:hypothetical protein
VIHNAVIHMNNEQPLVADLFEMPATSDLTLRCTNLRTLNGKRPVFADDQDSVFFFPWILIRFVEVLPSSQEGGDGRVAVRSGGRASSNGSGPLEDEPDLEIDEDFLKRIRDI